MPKAAVRSQVYLPEQRRKVGGKNVKGTTLFCGLWVLFVSFRYDVFLLLCYLGYCTIIEVHNLKFYQV